MSANIAIVKNERKPHLVTHKGGFNLGIFAFSLGTSSSKTPANAGLISSVINSTVTAIIVWSFDARKEDWLIITILLLINAVAFSPTTSRHLVIGGS